ncbi:Uncharacterized protein TCM_011072 [Theobroma cacao]|uniref:Uncharacterized protein n=1 Tax=Theobroma cacao TaxID=3641 RepID=A0A061E811_THECC|nr:Uncharacterized protein TCM_011072 [Theobroma cacao]
MYIQSGRFWGFCAAIFSERKEGGRKEGLGSAVGQGEKALVGLAANEGNKVGFGSCFTLVPVFLAKTFPRLEELLIEIAAKKAKVAAVEYFKLGFRQGHSTSICSS